jgi:membrane protein implicated in regulation of membrane protease activity
MGGAVGELHFLWWHWVVLGIVLVLLELAVPTFFLLWFGVGAIVVGIVLAVFPSLFFPWQILLWIACSVAFLGLWLKVFKPGKHKTRAGMSHGAVIGEIGLVTREIRPYGRGQVRFQKPLLGDDLWESIADVEIKVGERVKVLELEGNILKVGRV